MDPQSVNQATQALENAKHALNGAQNFKTIKIMLNKKLKLNRFN